MKSMRSKLLLIYLITSLVPALISSHAIAYYLSNSMASQRDTLINGTLDAMCKNIDTYLDDLNRLSTMPYMDDELLDAIEKVSDKDYSRSNPYDVGMAKQKVNKSFQVALNNNRENINGVLLVLNNNSANYFGRYSTGLVKEEYDYEAQDWYKKAVEANGKGVFVDVHRQNYLTKPEEGYVFSVVRLIKDLTTQNTIGVLMANADSKVLNSILDNKNFGVSSNVVIEDGKGNLVYSTNSISEKVRAQIFSGTESVADNGIEYKKISRHIDQTDWNLTVLMSYSELQKNITIVNFTTAILIIVQIFFAFLLFFFWSHSITNRFTKIRNVMDRAKRGDLSARYTDHSRDEISVLGNGLNDMIIKISNQIKNERNAINAINDAKFKALQSQINPHFLYNTLNCFLGINRLGKSDVLENYILALSGMMHYSFGHQERAELWEEFQFIGQYCELQKMRFGDRLHTEIQLEDDIRNFKIPKLLIQPLVENAIIHGIEPLGRKGTLIVSAAKEMSSEKQSIKISIQDDGAGFDAKTLSKEKDIGISNVEERLKIAYRNTDFCIKSIVGSGTQVTIQIFMEE